MAEPTGHPRNAKCFCCGTPADQIAEPQRFRRRWRRLCWYMIISGLAMIAGGFALLYFLSAPIGGFLVGAGFAWSSAGQTFISKFPKIPK